MREVLRGYLELFRREALAGYRFACVMYALQAPHLGKGERLEKPKLPPILRSIVTKEPFDANT